MRFESSSSSQQPLAPSWRMILWAAALAPALLILSWSVRQARPGKSDAALAGRTAEEAQRLQRILKNPQSGADSSLQGDSVRVLSTQDTTGRSGLADGNSASIKKLAPSEKSNSAPLNQSIFAPIEDNSFGVTAGEKSAYDAVLAKVRETPLAELERVEHRDVPFAVLMLEADRFRGEVITVEGDMRRLNSMNSEGEPSRGTYEAWLFTPDSGLNPYRVILTHLPDGILAAGEVKPLLRVRVTGYFFKRYSYATANDYHTAPLILAKTLTPLAPVGGTRSPVRQSRMLTIVAIGVLAAFGISWVVVGIWSRRRPRSGKPVQKDEEPIPDFKWLEHDS